MWRERRLETLIVAAIVLLTAFYVRAEYIPHWAERNLELAEQKWELPISHVGPWFSAWTQGDGQAYAVIASDPLGLDIGDDLKDAGYRYQRAGFSWLVWVGSGGQADLIPYAMAAVGALAVIGTLILAISLRKRLGPSTWFLVLNPALYIGFAGDTAESLAILFLGLALASSHLWAGVVLGVTRPDYLLALLGRWKTFTYGVVAAALVVGYATVRFGIESLFPDGARVFGSPLAGYIETPSLAGWVLALLAAVTLAIGVRFRNWTWAVVGLYVLCFSYTVVLDPVNAWRAAGLIPVLWAFGPRPVKTQRATESEDSPVAAVA
ncbi:MAG TPA: hypothetical protein VJA46_00145 [Acidimicrobiia bacterium]|nr:hypothetical protein [Acidimicrobiia bacterium]